MTDEKEDRRAARTREALIHALLELVEAKHYDQITVQDIVQRANVGRATFYAHYQSKDDLLMSGFEMQLRRLSGQIVLGEDNRLRFDTASLCRHAREHREIYRTLIWGSSFELLIKNGHAALSQQIEERLTVLLAARQPPPIPLTVLACVMAGVLLVSLKWWLDNKLPYTPERMDEIFQHLIMQSIQTDFGG